ncbi:hypothetical protein D5086_004993 [Populus alba]|uniref:Uncharacterized protein n=1 Tax=Populus alba TaxID=43335 RepID=A0ACC4CS06_POPAL
MSCSSSGLLTTCLIGLSVAACVLRIPAMVLPPSKFYFALSGALVMALAVDRKGKKCTAMAEGSAIIMARSLTNASGWKDP